jgi:hypothetical protein
MSSILTPRRQTTLGLLAAAGVAMRPGLTAAQTLSPIELPPPRADFGQSLARVPKARQSRREFAPRPLKGVPRQEQMR